MGDSRGDLVVTALSRLVPGGVVRGQLARPGGRRLRWIEAGATGCPRVVLVHGAGDVALDWAMILPALAVRFHVIAYDRAGLGASDRTRPLTLDSQVQDLVALLDAVGPAVLVGHSWGGMLVQLAASARPEGILGLVLLDPTHEEIAAYVPWTSRVLSSLMLNGIVLLKAAGLFNRIAAKMGRASAERCTDDPQIQALITDAYLESYATIGQVLTIRAENRLADASARRLRAVRSSLVTPNVPMRILTGTRSKPPALQQGSHELAERIAAAYPQGEHIRVPDSGHYLHKDQPGAVVAATVAVTAPIVHDRSFG